MAVQNALRQGLHSEDYSADSFDEQREAKRRTWQLCLFMDRCCPEGTLPDDEANRSYSAFSMHFGRPCLLGPFKQRADLFAVQSHLNVTHPSLTSERGPDEESSTFFYESLSAVLYPISPV